LLITTVKPAFAAVAVAKIGRSRVRTPRAFVATEPALYLFVRGANEPPLMALPPAVVLRYEGT